MMAAAHHLVVSRAAPLVAFVGQFGVVSDGETLFVRMLASRYSHANALARQRVAWAMR